MPCDDANDFIIDVENENSANRRIRPGKSPPSSEISAITISSTDSGVETSSAPGKKLNFQLWLVFWIWIKQNDFNCHSIQVIFQMLIVFISVRMSKRSAWNNCGALNSTTIWSRESRKFLQRSVGRSFPSMNAHQVEISNWLCVMQMKM